MYWSPRVTALASVSGILALLTAIVWGGSHLEKDSIKAASDAGVNAVVDDIAAKLMDSYPQYTITASFKLSATDIPHTLKGFKSAHTLQEAKDLIAAKTAELELKLPQGSQVEFSIQRTKHVMISGSIREGNDGPAETIQIKSGAKTTFVGRVKNSGEVTLAQGGGFRNL